MQWTKKFVSKLFGNIICFIQYVKIRLAYARITVSNVIML